MEELFQELLIHMGSRFTQERRTLTQPRQEILEVLENTNMSELFGLPRRDAGWSQSDLSMLSSILYEYNVLPVPVSPATISRIECGSAGITWSIYTYAYLLELDLLFFPEHPN